MPPGKPHWTPRAVGPAELVTLRRPVNDGVSVIEATRTPKIGRVANRHSFGGQAVRFRHLAGDAALAPSVRSPHCEVRMREGCY